MNKILKHIARKAIVMYSDPTMPGEIVEATVKEFEVLHDEGKLTIGYEPIYNYIKGIKRVKNPVDLIAECVADVDDDSGEEVEDEL